MVENLIVCILVGGALALMAKSLWRTLAGRDQGCGCGVECPLAQACEPRTEPGRSAHGGPA